MQSKLGQPDSINLVKSIAYSCNKKKAIQFIIVLVIYSSPTSRYSQLVDYGEISDLLQDVESQANWSADDIYGN